MSWHELSLVTSNYNTMWLDPAYYATLEISHSDPLHRAHTHISCSPHPIFRGSLCISHFTWLLIHTTCFLALLCYKPRLTPSALFT